MTGLQKADCCRHIFPLRWTTRAFIHEEKLYFCSIWQEAAEYQHLREGLENVETQLRSLVESFPRPALLLDEHAEVLAHDLRAPARTANNFAQLLAEEHGEQLKAAGRDYAQRILAATTRLDSLILDLLRYCQLDRQPCDLKRIDLGGCVQHVLIRLDEQICARKAAIRIKTPLFQVMGNEPLVELVLSNFLSNALRFSTPGQAPDIQIGTQRRDQSVRLWVADKGIGIDKKFHRRIFEVFERLSGDQLQPGSGIGLVYCAKAAQRMGGSVGVKSRLNHGSRFWIDLPAAV